MTNNDASANLEQQLKQSIINAKAQRRGRSLENSNPNPAPAAAPSQTPQTNHNSPFHKAVKFREKGRVALIGVSGSGKSFTGLRLARALAGASGKVAAIDTEHGSLSKYAHSPSCPPNCTDPSHFEFDVDEPTSYTDDYLLSRLTYAEQNGYAVFFVDSLSHFWMGADGTLEFVDKVRRRDQSGNAFAGWNAWTPKERRVIDRFIASPCHVVVTMRVKTEYQEVIENGKKKRVKVGLQPIQRDGLEYEFDLVCSMDDENNLLVDKTRCSAYSADQMRVAGKPDAKYFQPFIEWLSGGAERPPVPPVQPAAPVAPAGPIPIDRSGGSVSNGTTSNGTPAWCTSRAKIREEFEKIRPLVPENRYWDVLDNCGVGQELGFRTAGAAWMCYQRLQKLALRAADPITFENYEITEEGAWA